MIDVAEKRVLTLLGLIYRAGKCAHGIDMIVEAIQKNRTHYVLIAKDVKENTKKKLIDKCRSYNVPYRMFSDRKSLGNAIGKEERVAVAILDEGFARKVHSLLQN